MPVSTAHSPSRIQLANEKKILEAALEIFSTYGFRGSTLDQIAKQSGLSKPNILYYFSDKEAIHQRLIADLLDVWLAPLQQIESTASPLTALWAYIDKKLQMSRDMPRESRLFANEMLQGAPHVSNILKHNLKLMVDEKVLIIRGWIEQGLLAPHDPYHLLFSIWATTQHYADFAAQIHSILPDAPPEKPAKQPAAQIDNVAQDKLFCDAENFLKHLYLSALTPKA